MGVCVNLNVVGGRLRGTLPLVFTMSLHWVNNVQTRARCKSAASLISAVRGVGPTRSTRGLCA